MTPRIDKMTVRAKAPKRSPQIGDRKMIKGVEHVRQQVLYQREGAYAVSNGRPVCEWVPVERSRDYRSRR